MASRMSGRPGESAVCVFVAGPASANCAWLSDLRCSWRPVGAAVTGMGDRWLGPPWGHSLLVLHSSTSNRSTYSSGFLPWQSTGVSLPCRSPLWHGMALVPWAAIRPWLTRRSAMPLKAEEPCGCGTAFGPRALTSLGPFTM